MTPAAHVRHRCTRGLFVALVAAMGVTPLASEHLPTEPLPRVRSNHAAIGAAITLGRERSVTFRRLLDIIGASDGLVYVDHGVCRHSVNACLVLSVTVAGPNRMLRVLVDTTKATGCSLVGVIGHELQHTVEALAERSVRSGNAIYWLFDRIGRTGAGRFETADALEAGLTVEHEVCRQPAAPSSPPMTADVER